MSKAKRINTTTRKAKSLKAKPASQSLFDLYPLPFFNKRTKSCWDPKHTGDYAKDCETGEDLGRQFLQTADGTSCWANIIGWIVADMIRAGADRPRRGRTWRPINGVVVGFMATIGRVLNNPETGKRAVIIENLRAVERAHIAFETGCRVNLPVAVAINAHQSVQTAIDHFQTKETLPEKEFDRLCQLERNTLDAVGLSAARNIEEAIKRVVYLESCSRKQGGDELAGGGLSVAIQNLANYTRKR